MSQFRFDSWGMEGLLCRRPRLGQDGNFTVSGAAVGREGGRKRGCASEKHGETPVCHG